MVDNILGPITSRILLLKNWIEFLLVLLGIACSSLMTVRKLVREISDHNPLLLDTWNIVTSKGKIFVLILVGVNFLNLEIELLKFGGEILLPKIA